MLKMYIALCDQLRQMINDRHDKYFKELADKDSISAPDHAYAALPRCDMMHVLTWDIIHQWAEFTLGIVDAAQLDAVIVNADAVEALEAESLKRNGHTDYVATYLAYTQRKSTASGKNKRKK